MLRVSSSRCLIYKVHAASRRDLLYHSVLSLSSTFFRNFSNLLLFVLARASHELLHVTTSLSPCQVLSLNFFGEAPPSGWRELVYATTCLRPCQVLFSEASRPPGRFPFCSSAFLKRSVTIPNPPQLVNSLFQLFSRFFSGRTDVRRCGTCTP